MNKRLKTFLCMGLLLCVQTGIMAQELTPVKVNGVYGFNRNGASVIAPQFLYATHFSQGLALVKTKTGWGYINEKGTFVVEPKFTNAEPVRDSIGKVYLNGKCGIISNTGTVLLEPIYDSITFAWDGNYVYSGKLMGQANRNFTKITPILYTKFEANRDYLSALKSNGLWDIYYEDLLVLEDMQTPVTYDHYLFNSNIGLLKKNGKYGVYSAEEGWIFRPEFDTIVRLPFKRHTIKDNYFDELFLLQNYVPSQVNDNVDVYFKVMTGDGKLISEETFTGLDQASSVIGYQQNGGHVPGIFLYGPESSVLLYEDLSIRKLPFNKLDPFMEWFIVQDGNQQSILDYEFRKIASFDAVSRVVNATASEYYDDFGNLMETATQYDYLPYLKVSKKVNGQLKDALFSLYEKKVVTPFLTNGSFQSSVQGVEEMFAGYTYTGDESDYRGFYMEGMDMGTDLAFLEVNFYSNSRCVAFNPKTELNELYGIKNRRADFLMEDYTIQPAYTLIRQEETYVDSLGLFVVAASQNFFEYDFMISQNIEDKLGLLCLNGVRIPSQFDSILQHAGRGEFVDVYKNGLYGAVNIKTGEMIDAVSPVPMPLEYSEENKTWYTILRNDELGYYYGSYGPIYSLDPLWGSKVVDINGKKGVQVLSDFSGTMVQLIPAKYKKIVILKEGFTPLFVATNFEGRIGVLDVKGDTLAPFEFTGYEDTYFNNEQAVLILKKGKKEAVYDHYLGELIPPRYDSWKEMADVDGNYSFLQVTSGKKHGLYSFTGRELLPCNYDCINVITANSEDIQYKAIQVQREGKWWVVPIFVPDPGSFYYDAAFQSEIFFDTNQFNGPFDFLIGDYGYVRQPNGEFITHWANVPQVSTPESAPFEPVLEGILEIFQENGKLGVRQDGKIVLKPTFTNIRFYDDSTIIVSDGGSNFYYNLISKKRYKLEQW